MIKAIVLAALLAGCAAVPPSGPLTAYEGARLIVGDARVIENGTLLVQGTKILEAGKAQVPAGATRVNLAGKTVMPAIIDTHVHLGTTREALVRDLRQRAYYGVSAALSLGTDGYELLDVRGEEIPGAARWLSAGRGITIRNTRRISAVVLRGVAVDRSQPVR